MILPSQYCIVSHNYDNYLAGMHVEGPIIPERSCPTQTSSFVIEDFRKCVVRGVRICRYTKENETFITVGEEISQQI